MSKQETEYEAMQRKAGLSPIEKTCPNKKQQLDENFVGDVVINSIFPEREKEGYEMAFEHYVGNQYGDLDETEEEDADEYLNNQDNEDVNQIDQGETSTDLSDDGFDENQGSNNIKASILAFLQDGGSWDEVSELVKAMSEENDMNETPEPEVL